MINFHVGVLYFKSKINGVGRDLPSFLFLDDHIPEVLYLEEQVCSPEHKGFLWQSQPDP